MLQCAGDSCGIIGKGSTFVQVFVFVCAGQMALAFSFSIRFSTHSGGRRAGGQDKSQARSNENSSETHGGCARHWKNTAIECVSVMYHFWSLAPPPTSAVCGGKFALAEFPAAQLGGRNFELVTVLLLAATCIRAAATIERERISLSESTSRRLIHGGLGDRSVYRVKIS